MQEPTKLFDLLEWRRELHPERPVFKFKENGEWKEHYIDEYIEKVDLISYALLHLGVKKGENIGLISAGRPEWNYVDFGVQQTGAVLLPIYPTISEEDYQYILNDAEVRLLVVETPALYKKICNIREKLPKLENLCTIVPMEGVRSIEDIYEIGRQYLASHPDAPTAPEDIRKYVRYGASPRAAIAMAEAARAVALLDGRPSVGFDDVRSVAVPVLNHRLIPSYQARLDHRTPASLAEALLSSVSESGLDLPDSVQVG